MTGKPDQSKAQTGKIVISVDAMGGDAGPAVVVAGIAKSAEKNPNIGFILHGPEDELAPLVAKRRILADRVVIRHVDSVVTMDDKPSQVMRNGKGTSMWSALDAVKNGEAAGVVSCGNTGALMALSMLRLRKVPGVNPRDCDSLAITQPAGVQRDAGCGRRCARRRAGSAAIRADGHLLYS